STCILARQARAGGGVVERMPVISPRGLYHWARCWCGRHRGECARDRCRRVSADAASALTPQAGETVAAAAASPLSPPGFLLEVSRRATTTHRLPRSPRRGA